MSNSVIPSSATISACLIVKNEEVLLPDCLRSLLRAVDEIVVVDTGSSDATVAIAREFGCIVVQVPWTDDFSAARNQALEYASSQWILVVDADERLLTPDILRNTVQESSPNTGGYLVEVQSSSVRSDGGTDTYAVGMLRLFRNDQRIRFYGAIHEQVIDTILEIGSSVARSAVQFIHLGYNLSPSDMQAKHYRNLRLLTRTINQHPGDGYTLLQRGKTLLALGQPSEAIADFSLITSHAVVASPTVQALALSYTGVVHYQANRPSEALQCATASLRILPGQALAYFICGETYTDLGKFDAALDAYLQMRTNYRIDNAHTALAGDYRLPAALLAFRIGRCYAGLRQWGKAEEEFRRGLEANPLDVGCLVGCAEIALRKNTPHEAVRLLHLAVEHAPDREDVRKYLAVAETQAASRPQEYMQTEKEPSISGALIVGDNAEGLERALESLSHVCSEIAVVHTGSSLAIRDIISRFATQIVVRPWDDNFSAARNAALERCTGDWILVVDSDEYVDKTAAEAIRRAVAEAHTSIGGFVVGIVHIAGEERSTNAVLRLFRNLPTVRYEGFVHEQVTPSLTRNGLSIKEQPDIILHHYTAPMNSAKIKRYKMLLEKEIHRIGDTAEWPLFQYALLLFNFGDETDLIESLQSLDRYLQHPLMQRSNAAVLLNSYGRRLIAQEDWPRLAGIAEDSLAWFPDQREAWWHSTRAYGYLQDWPHALHSLQMLCASYNTAYHSTLVFEKEPTVENIINEGQKAALLSGDNKIRSLVQSFAMQHGHPVPDIPQAHPATVEVNRKSPQNRPLLSVSMIVKNEEKFLPGCLESIRSIADEIVIADTGSSDSTIAIAQSYGAVVVQTSWEGDFARARNFSLERCTGQWVLYVDADERLDPAQADYIRAIVEHAPEETGAFLCTIVSPHRQRDNSTEHHSGAYPRLFRNLGYPVVQFQGRVHEQISPSLLTAGKTIANSDIIIHHLGYEQSIEVMQKKVQRNFELLMRHIQEEPTNGQAWLHLGFTLAFMGKNSEAEEALKFALQLGNLNPHLEASAASTLAQIAGAARRFSDALRWAEHSIGKAPQQVYGLHLKAYALLYLGRFDEAETTFLEVLHRIDHPRQSRAGFDIAIKRETVVQGLQKARAKAV